MYSFSGNFAASQSQFPHVSVSDLYIPRIGPYISCSRLGRSIVGIYSYKSPQNHMNVDLWKWGLWPRNSSSGNICLEFSILVLCSVVPKKGQNLHTLIKKYINSANKLSKLFLKIVSRAICDH